MRGGGCGLRHGSSAPTRKLFEYLAWVLLALAFSASAGELRLEGKLVQGGLVTGYTQPGSRVTFNGRGVRVSDDGVFLIGFGRDAKPEAKLEIVYPDGRKAQRVLKIARRDYRIQRIDGLPPRKVTPKAEDLKRIRQENALVKTARDAGGMTRARISCVDSSGRPRGASAAFTAASEF